MKNPLKTVIQGLMDQRSKPYLYLYHRFYKRASFPSLLHFVTQYARLKQEVTFMQIGANEGSTEDPLYPHIRLRNWRGILVEPQAKEFEQLKINHKHSPQLIFEQVAISNSSSSQEFYYIDQQQGNVPNWVSKLSSFDRNITAQVLEVFPEATIASDIIECTTVMALLEKHNIQQLDLMLIDTEGYDYEIIKTVDWQVVQPEVIVYEHRHLSESDLAESRQLFRDLNYDLFLDEYDTIAFKQEALKALYQDHLG